METLNRKITITKDGQNKIIDFAEPTYIPDFENENFTIIRTIYVSKEYEKRLDLVSLAVYGSDDYVDILMKCNEISDPLSIKEGDVLAIPDLEGAKLFYINPFKESKEAKQNILDSTKKSKVDQKRLETLAKISSSIKNGSKVNTKTNDLKPGETNIEANKETNSIGI